MKTEKEETAIELKSYRPAHNLSHETLAFTATIYISGKRAGTVENDGNGGENMYCWASDDAESAFRACVLNDPRATFVGSDGRSYQYADVLIGALCDAEEERRWIKRNTKNKVLFRLRGDDEGAWRTVSCTGHGATKDGAIRFIKDKHGDRIERIES